MKNQFTSPPWTRTAFTLTICPNQQKSRLRALEAKHASLVKQLAFVDSQIERVAKAIFPVSAFRSPVSK
ncbi:MAG: hypothetical protein WCO94_15590 [Verrucomicrobiota bacterium]